MEKYLIYKNFFYLDTTTVGQSALRRQNFASCLFPFWGHDSYTA